MTLEDFFTLTEMTDGLTVPARVKELVTNMQKERDSVVKNMSDATRQWSTVASTLAATENTDCLDLFIKLDGLWFIDRWLKDAQKFSNDPSESCIEESIISLLQALEKLHIDNEKSVSSGIWMTVENLLSHTSSKVQDRARDLFGRWKQERDGNALFQDVENGAAIRNDDLAVESGLPECASRGLSSEEKHVELARDELMRPVSSEALQSEMVNDVQIQSSDEITGNPVNMDGPLVPVCSSVLLEPFKENLSIKEESTKFCSHETTSIDNSNPVVTDQSIIEGKLDDDKNIGSPQDKLGVAEKSPVSSPLEPGTLSSSVDLANDPNSLLEGRLQNHIDAKDEDFSLKASQLDDSTTVLSEGKSGIDDIGSPNQCGRAQKFKPTVQVGECEHSISQDSSGSESVSGKSENSDSYFSWKEGYGVVDKVQGHDSNEGGGLANHKRLAVAAKDPTVISKRSDIELDDVMIDAIEVARQVAIEVEREVDSREEQSCSSSEKISGGGIRQPDSVDSIDGRECEPIDGPSEEVPTGLSPCAEIPPKEEPIISEEIRDTEPENHVLDMHSSQVMESAQEPEGNNKNDLCDFDLNQEVCSEDMDQLGNSISTPISVVSASRAAAAPGLPASPLQFDGALGWKGSAATSAFRPASPRRNPEFDKTLSTGGSSNSSKQRLDFLDIDLNVAEVEDDRVADLVPVKQMTISSGLPSGESSVEGNSRRSERLKLDLNRSDDGDCQSDWRMERRLFQHRNGHHSPSPSSSSSSMQPLLKNFDLNDQPALYNDYLDQQPYLGKSSSQTLNAFGGIKSGGDSMISIMGARVEVNPTDFVPPNPPLPNGRNSEPAMDLNLAQRGGVFRMGLPYAQSPVYGYNGLAAGPTMSFSPAIYGSGGPIPYMVDSRGGHVVPQIMMGSASSVPPSFSQPPFIMGMAGTFQGSNGAGPSRPNLDLNYGLMIDGGNNRDLGPGPGPGPGHGHGHGHGHGGMVDEQLRINLQPSSSSGVGGKRKEPENGWETYPFIYKNQQSPWR